MTSSKNQHKGLPPQIEYLLRLYYAGDTNESQEKELADYFVAAEDIPEENVVDAMIFRQIAAHNSDDEMPEGLEERLIKSTCGKKVRIMPRWITYSAAAVIAALIAGSAMWHFNSKSDDMPTINVEDIAKAEKTEIVTDETMAESMAERLPSQKADDSVNSEPEKVIQIVLPVAHKQEDDLMADGLYIEITDPDSVAEITRNVLDRLGAALALAGEAAEKTKSGLEPIESSMEDILQPITTIDKTIKTITQ